MNEQFETTGTLWRGEFLSHRGLLAAASVRLEPSPRLFERASIVGTGRCRSPSRCTTSAPWASVNRSSFIATERSARQQAAWPRPRRPPGNAMDAETRAHLPARDTLLLFDRDESAGNTAFDPSNLFHRLLRRLADSQQYGPITLAIRSRRPGPTALQGRTASCTGAAARRHRSRFRAVYVA